MIKIEKPEYKWYYFIPFTRGRKDYIKDRNRYEEQFLTPIQKIRKKEENTINGTSVLLIGIITGLWTFLPTYVDLPNWLQWMNMGMEGFGSSNWGNQIMLTFIPMSAGTLIHKFPYIIPNKAIKTGVNIGIKIIPVILLIICYYIIFQEKKIRELKRLEKFQGEFKDEVGKNLDEPLS